jgi:secreted trypsin-like serine protease
VRLAPVLAALLLALAASRAAAVAGGQPGVAADWPFAAALLASDGQQVCGGTIVRPRWVLTAAHCVTDDAGRALAPADLRVGTGSDDLRHVRVRAVRQVVPFPHAAFLPDGAAVHDVALLHLARPAPGSPGRLAPPGAAHGPAASAWLAGWGALDRAERRYPVRLRTGTMTVAPSARCRVEEGVAGVLCAGAPGSEDVSGCAGDSGGPLVDRGGPVPVVIGVLSYGDPACGRGVRSVFADVARYRRWIDHAIRARSATPAGAPRTRG